MKLLHASIAVIAISLCAAGCKKTETTNTVTTNTTEETTMNAEAPVAADMNAVDTNAMNGTDNATGNGDRQDNGPRG